MKDWLHRLDKYEIIKYFIHCLLRNYEINAEFKINICDMSYQVDIYDFTYEPLIWRSIRSQSTCMIIKQIVSSLQNGKNDKDPTDKLIELSLGKEYIYIYTHVYF